MRRVLALLAAAAMVAGSVAVRARLDRRQQEGANPLRVVCAEELGPVCDQLRQSASSTVEPATATADRLSTTEDPGVNGWLVPAPWPQIVDGRRRQRGFAALFADPGPPLARSPLVLVVERALAQKLRPLCGGTVGWKCLGDQAVPGPAKPGHADPGTDALGTLLTGQATAAFFGRAGDLSTIDLEQAEFARWFQALERATPRTFSGGSPLDDMLGTNFAAYNAVGTIEAEAAPVLAASAIQDRVELLYPEPMATADVVLVGSGGTRPLRDTARRALADAHWRVEGITRATTPPLPATNGLPAPGFLDALRSLAQEVRR